MGYFLAIYTNPSLAIAITNVKIKRIYYSKKIPFFILNRTTMELFSIKSSITRPSRRLLDKLLSLNKCFVSFLPHIFPH